MFLPTQLGLHFWPSWAFILGRRVDYLSPTIYLTDLLLVATVGSWMVSTFLGSFPRRRESRLQKLDPRIKSEDDKRRRLQKNKRNILNVFSPLCFFIFVGFNIFLANNKLVALYHWIKVLEYGLLALYIWKTKPRIQDIVFPLSIGVLYSSLIAIGQFVLQHSVGLWILGERTFGATTPGIAKTVWCQFSKTGCVTLLRAYATFPHPNVLGGFLAVTMPLIISNFQFLISNQTKKVSILKLTTLLVGVVALLLTFSRSAIIIFVLSIVYSVWRKKKDSKNEIPAFAGMTKGWRGMTTIVAGVIIGLVILFLLVPLSSVDESVVVRQQLNEAAVKQFISSPLVGVGLGNFLVELPKTLFSKGVYFLQPAHNIYLLLLAEVGLFGVGLVSLFVLSLYRVLGITYRGKNKIHNTAYTIPLLALLLLGLVDHYPLTLQQGQLLFALLLGLTITNNS